MTDSNQPSNPEQPVLTPQQERRLRAIRRCTEGALSKAQKYIEDKYMNPDLRCLLDGYMGGFKRYLPEVCDLESARDFIACVTYGMSIEAISMDSGTKLIYAGQVAINALRPGKDEKPSKE